MTFIMKLRWRLWGNLAHVVLMRQRTRVGFPQTIFDMISPPVAIMKRKMMEILRCLCVTKIWKSNFLCICHFSYRNPIWPYSKQIRVFTPLINPVLRICCRFRKTFVSYSVCFRRHGSNFIFYDYAKSLNDCSLVFMCSTPHFLVV